MEILITGGTGSFGQAFTKYLLKENLANRIALFSRGEHAQETMAHEIKDQKLRFFIGDVRDDDRLEFAMRGIDVVVHAAALKIVPAAEYNPTECIATNVVGAQNVVKAALRCGVKKVIGLSTDKAVNPINLYGASKLAAEKVLIASNALSAGRSAFCTVRYGNVVGSRGSVIPLFKRFLAEGRRLTITDKRMTRFWITMDQAIGLVRYALDNARGHEIFIPKIPSMRIVDLADAMDPGGLRDFIGIRPGEKIHECLMTEDENAYDMNKFYVVLPPGMKRNYPKVRDGFRYTSDGNDQWLSPDELRGFL